MGLRALLGAAVLALGLLVAPLPAQAASPAASPVVTVAGSAVFDETLEASAAGFAGAVAYQWLRDGAPVAGATSRRLRLGLDDLGRRMSVTVTGTDAETSAVSSATSAAGEPVARAALTSTRAPRVVGVPRYGRALRADAGRWSATPSRVRYQWYRAGAAIAGATSARYAVAPADVGLRLRVAVTAKAPGHTPATARSASGERVRHRVDVRRVVTYHVETRGVIGTSLADFRRQAQETYDDPRGWRGSGIEFRRVASGGSFTLVLAQASLVPSFSAVCSSSWSCRVGRYVIINTERWQHASPAWNAADGALRDYRHMVVNHETGHWLGLGHAGCPGPGRLAPVMMQQSKGLDGCRFNPWPTPGEVAGRTPPAA